MKKKLCTVAVSLMVGLSLMACGGNAKQAESAKGSEAGTTAAEEKGSDSAEKAEDVKGSGEVVVYSPNSDSEIAAVVPLFSPWEPEMFLLGWKRRRITLRQT